MSTNALLSYARSMFNTYNLKKERRIGQIENYVNFDIELFADIINLCDYDYEIIKKTNIEGFYMNWHLDNALVIKNKKNDLSKKYDSLNISERHTLHYYIKKPIYTLIVYESDYGIDFTGGTLEFIDGIVVKPKKGTYVFFNSNEAHRVNKILSGSRINYLIKFYQK
jgi:hypothetical protein